MPLDSQLADGVVHRSDTVGGIDYTFECDRGFVMNGSNHVTCEEGVYNGSAPNCLPKGELNCRYIVVNVYSTNVLQFSCVDHEFRPNVVNVAVDLF